MYLGLSGRPDQIGRHGVGMDCKRRGCLVWTVLLIESAHHVCLVRSGIDNVERRQEKLSFVYIVRSLVARPS